MPDAFILIASDAETFGGAMATSFEVASLRLRHNYWPLHERTRNRKVMRPGDNVLIYCGGQSKKSKLIIAKSVIKKIDRHSARDELPEEVEFVTGNAFEIIRLSETNIFETPVNFKEVLPKLSFCPSNMGKWGVVLHGGARRISADDFGMLIPSR